MPLHSDWQLKFDFPSYWASVLTDARPSGDAITGRCPFHEDSHASFSASTKSPGLWNCHAGCGGGEIVGFHARLNCLAPHDAEEDLRIICGDRPIVPEAEVVEAHAKLLASPAIIEFLRAQRGIHKDTIEKFRLGFDGSRIWIPVLTATGKIANVRRYDYTSNPTLAKTLNYGSSGYGSTRLFPAENLKKKDCPLYVFEGETDMLLANQLGLPGVTSTSGAGTRWRSRFIDHAAGRDVVICYDIDKPGKKGAEELAFDLLPIAKTVKVINLPIVEPPNGDFTDYIVRWGHSADDFLELVEQTLPYEKPSAPDWKSDVSIHKSSLSMAADKRFYFKHVEIPVTTAGKDLTPWYAPKKISIACPRAGGRKCAVCPCNAGAMEVEIAVGQDILKLIDCTEQDQRNAIGKISGIHGCLMWRHLATEVYDVEEVRAIPQVTFSDEASQYVARTVYSIAPEAIRTNKGYRFTGIAMPHPATQYATALVYKAEQEEASFDRFTIGETEKDNLDRLLPDYPKPPEGRPNDPPDTMLCLEALDGKLKAIAEDISVNVARVYQRDDLILAALIAWATVRRFRFNKEDVRKGWAELLVIGDTRTGKSKSVENIQRWLNLGELITGENTTFAGLVGGMSQVGSRWNLTWGKIPLNNGGLLVIDEASGLSEECIAGMSGIRSSGVAEITKIQTEKTEAQTRMIWVSNPRSGRPLSTYTYGVLAVRELLGNSEDVARMDFAVTAASGEVDPSVINSSDHGDVPHVHTAETLRTAILWAWSRNASQVEFTYSATERALDAAKRLGATYSSSIPLVESGEMRIKIAKLAVAVAALTASTVDYQTIVVEDWHVLWVAGFLDRLYSKPSMGYRAYSEMAAKSASIDGPTRAAVIDEFQKLARWREVLEAFLSSELFRKRDFLDAIGYDNDEGKALWSWANRRRLLAAKAAGFVKTPVFTSILRDLCRIAAEEKTSEEPPSPIPAADMLGEF